MAAKTNFLSAMISYHKFFVSETPSFIGELGKKWRVRKTLTTEVHEQYYPLTLRQRIKYPIAYIRFMYFMGKYWLAWKKYHKQQ